MQLRGVGAAQDRLADDVVDEQQFVDRRPAPIAGAAAVRAAGRGRDLVVLSFLGKLSYYLSRLAPGWYSRGMVRRLKDQEP